MRLIDSSDRLPTKYPTSCVVMDGLPCVDGSPQSLTAGAACPGHTHRPNVGDLPDPVGRPWSAERTDVRQAPDRAGCRRQTGDGTTALGVVAERGAPHGVPVQPAAELAAAAVRRLDASARLGAAPVVGTGPAGVGPVDRGPGLRRRADLRPAGGARGLRSATPCSAR